MKLVRLLFVPLVASLTLILIPTAFSDLDRSSSTQKALRPCINTSELDCIESLVVLYPNGKSSSLQLIQPASGTSLDEYGQVLENSSSVWTYRDLKDISRSGYEYETKREWYDERGSGAEEIVADVMVDWYENEFSHELTELQKEELSKKLINVYDSLQ